MPTSAQLKLLGVRNMQQTRGKARLAGFTLVELMVTVIIITILAAIAIPSYQAYVVKGRRADAFSALSAVQQAQERWRANAPIYATDLSEQLKFDSSLGGSNYSISVANVSASGYTVVATAKASGRQRDDGDCATMSVILNRGTITYTSSNKAGDSTNDKCWPK